MEKIKKMCKQALPVAVLAVMFALGTVTGYLLHGSMLPNVVNTMAAEHMETQGNMQTAAPPETTEAVTEETEPPPAPEAKPAAAEQTAPPIAQAASSLDNVTVWLADNPSVYHTRKTCHHLRQTREKGHENTMKLGDAKKLWHKCADCPAPSVN